VNAKLVAESTTEPSAGLEVGVAVGDVVGDALTGT
jgi:hypothetical protein